MLKKISAALTIVFLLSGGEGLAYDLPKIKPDKKISTEQKGPMLKSDWTSAELFEQAIRARIATGEPLAPDDPARVAADKNFVFVAFYKDIPYFLDRYSVKARKTKDGSQVWEQKLFPISKKISAKNSVAIRQTFRFSDGKIFNSSKTKDAIIDVADDADRIFLAECARVGHHFAFEHGN